MKKLLYLLVILILSLGCESEERQKQLAQEVVNAFISNILVDNYESMFEYYPSFRELNGNYWKYNSLELTSTIMKQDGSIEIFAKSRSNNQLFFKLIKIDGEFKIVNSKGLSAYYNSNLYKYCENIGCIALTDYDLEIAQVCEINKKDYNDLINSIKTRIEENTVLVNHTLSKSFGTVSGNITVKNRTRFTVPEYAYDIYVNFLNTSNEVLFSYEDGNSFRSIPANGISTLLVFKDAKNGYAQVDVELKILKTDFIEKIIAEHSEGTRCIYSDNL
ncbi:hypothetical protein [Aestuariibaculum suncheonense]|uniref:Uncharacterized protein n=1 Tax=Aestuariibaculum suncheonense TaxID=1028745 RepID=A0A8J6Q5L3_9FLAO|nr:hypothetical protein [Aestuariibaculum suncheonense]MBD0834461.1 hypothetical protein [Aestuariibaculum suncheonense]